MSLFSFFSGKLPVDTKQIEQAISHLEQQTSAEVRVVVERKAKTNDALARANQLFDELKMRETAQRNGVLIYLAFKPHLLAVAGDEAIHQQVGQDFWDGVYAAMKTQCQQGNYTEALLAAIEAVKKPLSVHFPRQADDVNELSDTVVIK